MSVAELPYNQKSEYVLELIHEAERGRISLQILDRLHVILTAFMCFATFATALVWMGTLGWVLSASGMILCLVALLLSHALRIPIGDLYRQFQYREKFLLFLVHCGIVFGTRYFLGVRDWSIVLGILVVILCIQGIDRFFYGRIYAVAAAIIVWRCVEADPMPSAWMVAAWAFVFLLTIRFDHIRFRLDRHGINTAINVRETILRSLVPTMAPVFIGYIFYVVASMYLQPKALVFQPGYIERDGDDVFISVSEILWESFLFMAAIILMLVALSWLEKKLRRRARGATPEIEEVATTAHRYKMETVPGDALIVDSSGGPRDRILSAFRQFATTMRLISHGRDDYETAEEYLVRVGSQFDALRDLPDQTLSSFNQACYAPDEPSDEEADAYVKRMQDSITELRAAIDAENAPKHLEPGGDKNGQGS